MMKTNKISRIFLLLVLSTLASSQELADPFSPRSPDEGVISCNGRYAVCVGPVMYKYCIIDISGRWIASGATFQCPRNWRCVNDGVDICVPLKTSTEEPLIQAIINSTSSVAVPTPPTENLISTSSSTTSSLTSVSITTGGSSNIANNTGHTKPTETAKVIVKTTLIPEETSNAPVETTVNPDLPQMNTVAAVEELELSSADIAVRGEETTVLPHDQIALQETTTSPVFIEGNIVEETSTTNYADLNFDIISTIEPAEENSLLDATEPNSFQDVNRNNPVDLNLNPDNLISYQADPNELQTSDTPPIEISTLPVEPELTPVNLNVSPGTAVGDISTTLDPSFKQTTNNLPKDPTLLEEKTTVIFDQTSTPTVFTFEANPTVSVNKNIPEEDSLISIDPTILYEANVSSSTSGNELTNPNTPVSSTALPTATSSSQVLIKETGSINATSGIEEASQVLKTTSPTNLSNNSLPMISDLDSSPQAPLDSTVKTISTNSSSPQQSDTTISPAPSVQEATFPVPTELPADTIGNVGVTAPILEKPAIIAIETQPQIALVTSLPTNLNITANPSIRAVSTAEVDLNSFENTTSTAKPNEPVSTTSSAGTQPPSSSHGNPITASESGVLLDSNALVSTRVNPTTAADTDKPLSTNVIIDASATAIQNNELSINIANASSTLVTPVNPITSGDPTTPPQLILQEQFSTEPSILGNPDVTDLNISLNPSASVNSGITNISLNSSAINSDSLAAASAVGIASNSGNSAVSSNIPSKQSVVPSTPDNPNITPDLGVPLSSNAPLTPNAGSDSAIPLSTNVDIDSTATAVQNNKVAVNISNASAEHTAAPQPSLPAQPSTNTNILGSPDASGDASVTLNPNSSLNSQSTINSNVVVNKNEVNSVSLTVAGNNSAVSSRPPSMSVSSTPYNSSIPSDISVPLTPNTPVRAGVDPKSAAKSNAPLSTNIVFDSAAVAIQNNKIALNIPNQSGPLGTTINPIVAANNNITAKPSTPTIQISNPDAFVNPKVSDVGLSLNPSVSVSSIAPVNINLPLSSSAGSTAGIKYNSAASPDLLSKQSAVSSSSGNPSLSADINVPLSPKDSVSGDVNRNATVESSPNQEINSKTTTIGQNILIGSIEQGASSTVAAHSLPINPIASAVAMATTQATVNPTILRDPNVTSDVVLNPNPSVNSNAAATTDGPQEANAVTSSSGDLLTSSVSRGSDNKKPTDKLSESVPTVTDNASSSVSINSETKVSIAPILPSSSIGTADSGVNIVQQPNTAIHSTKPEKPESPEIESIESEESDKEKPDSSNYKQDEYNKKKTEEKEKKKEEETKRKEEKTNQQEEKKAESLETESIESEESVKEKSDSNEDSSKEDKSKETNDSNKGEKRKTKCEEKKKRKEQEKKRKEEKKRQKEDRKKIREEEKKHKNERKNSSVSSEDSNEDEIKLQEEEKYYLVKRITKNIKKNQCDEDDIYPDVKDCNNYYRCVEKYDSTKFVHMHCEDGKLYDFKKEMCIEESQARCLLEEE